MGRMKLTKKEWMLLTQVFTTVLEHDDNKREEDNESWFVTKNGEDIRPQVEETYKYILGIPKRSQARKKFSTVGIPSEMSMKIDSDNYLPLEWTLCYHSKFWRFKDDEAQETIEKLFDRLQLHHRRSFARKNRLGRTRILCEELDIESIDNPVPDMREREYHKGPDEPSFISLDKVGEIEAKKIPPKLSKQMKFILVKLKKENSKTEISKSVAKEFDRELDQNHYSSFNETINRLEDRGLVERNEDKIKLTTEGKGVSKKLIQKIEDGRYSLSFQQIH